jgi:hypothetical protein
MKSKIFFYENSTISYLAILAAVISLSCCSTIASRAPQSEIFLSYSAWISLEKQQYSISAAKRHEWWSLYYKRAKGPLRIVRK